MWLVLWAVAGLEFKTQRGAAVQTDSQLEPSVKGLREGPETCAPSTDLYEHASAFRDALAERRLDSRDAGLLHAVLGSCYAPHPGGARLVEALSALVAVGAPPEQLRGLNDALNEYSSSASFLQGDGAADAGPATHVPLNALAHPPALRPLPASGRRVGFCVAVLTWHGGNTAFAMSLAVIPTALKRAQAQSKRGDTYEAVALVPEASEAAVQFLESVGYRVVRKEAPLQPEAMKMPLQAFANTDRAYDNRSRSLTEEHVELHFLALTEYDKVAYMDPDVVMLDQNLDELIDDPAECVGIYDYAGQGNFSAIPPINGGFVMNRPSLETYRGVVEMVERGNFSSTLAGHGGKVANGWDQSGIGYYFGGISLQGLLAAYYHGDLMREQSGDWTEAFAKVRRDPRLAFKEADQCVYNVLGHDNCRGALYHNGEENVWEKYCHWNVECDKEQDVAKVIHGARVAHMTGGCHDARPWGLCSRDAPGPEAATALRNPLCASFTGHWMRQAEEALRSPAVAEAAPRLAACLGDLQLRRLDRNKELDALQGRLALLEVPEDLQRHAQQRGARAARSGSAGGAARAP